MTWPNPKGKRLRITEPAVGVSTKLPAGVVAAVDNYARFAGLTRSAVVSQVITQAFAEHLEVAR